MSTFNPIYRISKDSKTVVKFISPNQGYVIDPGNTRLKLGTLYEMIPYTDDKWEPYNYGDTTANIADHLKLFETIRLTGVSSSTLTKVPNGYVMTSHSGHQLFIKDISKESL